MIKICEEKKTQAINKFNELLGLNKSSNVSISGQVYFNDKLVTLPNPFSSDKMNLAELLGSG